MIVLITILVSYVSILLVRRVPRVGRDYFDFGLIFVAPILTMLISLSLFVTLGVDLTQFKEWEVFANVQNTIDTIYIYLVYIFTYSLIYNIGSNYKYTVTDSIARYNKSTVYLLFTIFTLIFILFFLNDSGSVDFTSNSSLYNQLRNVFVKFYHVVVALFFLVLFIDFKNPKVAFYTLVLVIITLTLISFIYTKSRGFLITILIVAALLDTIRWRGQLVSKWTFVLTIVGGSFVFALFNFVEAWYLGNTNFYFFLQVFEFRPLQTTFEIIKSVDLGLEPLRLGGTYLDAMIGLIPTQIRPYSVQNLSIYYASTYYPEAFKIGWAAAFSGIAEGYMNFKYAGVVLQAVIYAIISVFIRNLRYRYGLFGALFYSLSLPLAYKMTRVDLSYVVHNLMWMLIVLPLFFLFYKVFLGQFARSKKRD